MCDHINAIVEIASDVSYPTIYERECLDCGIRENGYIVRVKGKYKCFFIPTSNIDKVSNLEKDLEYF